MKFQIKKIPNGLLRDFVKIRQTANFSQFVMKIYEKKKKSGCAKTQNEKNFTNTNISIEVVEKPNIFSVLKL